MLTLPLEPTDDRARPIFKDAESCALWLGQLQLTNLQQAHSQLLIQLNELNRYPMRGLVRLETLEQLRETIEHVQDDFAKKLIAKPLPLGDNELLVFIAIVQLWQSLVMGYQRCLQSHISGDKSLQNHGALLCQRCLHYTGAAIFEHLCTSYEVDEKLWHQLHELYAYAEQNDLQQTDVPDSLKPELPHINCVSSYVRILLACYAHPARLTRWQLQQLDSWLSLWSNEITVKDHCKINKSDAHPLVADLTSRQGLQQLASIQTRQHDGLRFLAMAPLSKLLRVKTILLQQGQTPLQAGLGDHYDRKACIDFLTFLHRCWCENSQQRLGERRSTSLAAKICYKFDGIYAHMTSMPFNPQKPIETFGRLSHSEIETVSATKRLKQEHELVEMGYPLENWLMQDESVSGARLIREDHVGGRLAHQQLVALRPAGSESFLLCSTAWVNVTRLNQLQIGVRYLHGQALPVTIRQATLNPSENADCAPGFLFPALPEIKSPASLIVPREWYKAEHVLELEHPEGDKIKVKLGFSVEHGADYERVSFKVLKDEKPAPRRV
ncbi:MAG: hypothetical protein PHF75_06900 [Gallionella sp.]|nr:hypothetical protein [Gallionella sp.]